MAKLTDKISGSTLIEALVAIVVVTICMSIALMIILNISETNNNRLRLFASQQAEVIMEQTKLTRQFVNQEIELEGITIEKTIDFYQRQEDLGLLVVRVYNMKGVKLLEKKELLILE